MNYILQRFKEPSTYAGLAAIFSGMKFIPHAEELSQLIPSVGVVIAGLLAVFVKEAKA